MNDTPKRRGRPPKPKADLKRNYVTTALPDDTHEALRLAAARNGRSISSEIDFRLGMSLALDEDTGHPHTRRLVDFVRLSASALEYEYGATWAEKRNVAIALSAAIDAYIDRTTEPKMPFPPDFAERRDQMNAELKALGPDPFSQENGDAALAIRKKYLDVVSYIVARAEYADDHRRRGRVLTARFRKLFSVRDRTEGDDDAA